ncbi:MAG: DNA helicase-2/ATP-dependent DNA helicase PcrA [bacterium]|jgi:DNA helicase-2/ATP-dependent DNA helicase PcrA
MQQNTFLNLLNPEQKLAVTHIDGPVMVIAGPGTGKTQILASRVAQILAMTDSSAHNLLCLTYTEAGTIAMRKRLLSLIGHDAHRVAIHTFHGFCNRVIQDNSEHFNYKELDPISELEKIELISDIAIHLDKSHPLKKMKGNVGYLVGALSKLFDWMKMENVTPEDIQKQVEKLKVDMLEDESFKYKRAHKNFVKGDLKIDQYNKAEKKLNDLASAAHLFVEYEQQMDLSNRYDYADMILWVIDLFGKDSNVLADYQEQFQYFLVDEFQDTSGAQNAVLSLLLNFWDKPNVFVVGDDDQSIYRFQGAEVKNVVDFASNNKDHLKSILLQTNYRSGQFILDAAKSVINNNGGRLVNLIDGLDKNLKAASNKNGQNPEVVSLDNPYMEAIWIAEDIKTKIQQGQNPVDFAVIYGKHAHGELIAQLLHHEEIPVYLKRAQNVLSADTVSRLIHILRYIQKELRFPFSGDFELFGLLHFPYFEIPSIVLARLSYFINKNRQKYPNWRSVIAEIDTLKLDDLRFTEAHVRQLKQASKTIEDLISFASLHSPNMTARKVLDSLQLSQAAFEQNQFTFELESIISFLNFVESENSKAPNTSLEQLLRKLELMEKHRISLSKESIVYDKLGVNMLTAHSSKGLEFKNVYIIHCVESAWEKHKKPGSPFGVNKLYGSDDNLAREEELRRLFYVAMTRAEESLTLTYYIEDAKGKEQSRSMFIDEVLNSESTNYRHEVVTEKVSLDKLTNVFIKNAAHTIDLLDPPFLEAYLETYKLSVSHLNSYIECPTRFYFQNILRVPSAKNVYMSFGIAVHNALDQIIKVLNTEPDKFNIQTVQELYTYYLKRERSVFTEKEFEDFTVLGKSVLEEYLTQKKSDWEQLDKIETEVNIDRVVVDGVPITGKLDKIEFDGKTVNVVDYKTGDALNGSKKINPPSATAAEDDTLAKRFGGPYWRQIMFYSLLVNNDTTRDYTMVSGEMDFVEPNEQGQLVSKKVFINEETQAQIKTMIKSVFDKIQNKEFANGCMKPDCYWCSFIQKTHIK